ncbi:SDR family NAD(P)-dependent oxidoreductase [Streptomyces sp. NPDC021056]|uniref:SDR family NAD(P)-dependent oxidoreductase n=1 Tax=Streptomyces sp. NPDC021056 TaxID=3155012 RepID=UPI00340C467C
MLVNNSGTGHDPVPRSGSQHRAPGRRRRSGGPFLCAQRAVHRMIVQGGGRIINVTSVHEHRPRVGAAPYCAARAASDCSTLPAMDPPIRRSDSACRSCPA